MDNATIPGKDNGLIISSPSFKEGEQIPAVYTCDGEEISPPLQISNIPDGCQTLAIIAEDPDTAKGIFDHWIVWNIPKTEKVEEGVNPGISGTNGAGKTGYHGPCPPSGNHRYFFYVFALDGYLDLPAGSDKQQLKDAMTPHLLSRGTLMGKYQKTK